MMAFIQLDALGQRSARGGPRSFTAVHRDDAVAPFSGPSLGHPGAGRSDLSQPFALADRDDSRFPISGGELARDSPPTPVTKSEKDHCMPPIV
jgi:hypothetical protein